jgi:exosortase
MLLPRSFPTSVATAFWPTLLASLALLWGDWPTLLTLQETWATDPRYSHGWLVPLFSLYLIGSRWGRIVEVEARPAAGGLLLIAVGIVMHVGGGAVNQDWIEAASLLPSLAGLAVIARGWAILRPTWAPIAFLVFMIPLPYRVELQLGGPLQRLATHASAILLQVAGLPALEEGNTITLGHATIGIVEACNGLSLLTFFFAISAGLVLCVRRPWLERSLIIAGAIPIALIANIARITATGLLVEGVGHGIAGIEFHDLTGYLMMPFALVLLYAEDALLLGLFQDGATRTAPHPADGLSTL